MFKAMKKYLLIILGTLALSLGVIGIFLPVLPTTPFLLLSMFCYLRSSKKLYKWLMRHKIFGTYIYNYLVYRAVSKKTKIYSVILLWTSLIISILIIDSWYIKASLILVGIGVSIHIITLKTIEKPELIKLIYRDETEE